MAKGSTITLVVFFILALSGLGFVLYLYFRERSRRNDVAELISIYTRPERIYSFGGGTNDPIPLKCPSGKNIRILSADITANCKKRKTYPTAELKSFIDGKNTFNIGAGKVFTYVTDPCPNANISKVVHGNYICE